LLKLTRVNQKKLKVINAILGDLNYVISSYAVIAGGALKSIFDNRFPSDFDIFILSNSKEELLSRKKQIEDHLSLTYKKVFDCPKGELTTFKCGPYKIQIVNVDNKIYSSPKDIIDCFDFDVCCMAFHLGTLYIKKEAIKNIRSRVLTLNRLPYPASTIYRLGKYKQAGFITSKVAREIVAKIGSMVHNGEKFDDETIYVD